MFFQWKIFDRRPTLSLTVHEHIHVGLTDSFNNNKVVQTILNHIDVTIHKKSENNVDLYVRRSFAKHLWDWLKDSSNLI